MYSNIPPPHLILAGSSVKGDGVVKMWLDGVLVTDYSNADIRDSYTVRGWNMFQISGNDPAAPAQTWSPYWDNVEVGVYEPGP